MPSDLRSQCAVCAWRENCAKKHRSMEVALQCPDFCRDAALREEDVGSAESERHKRVEDVFR